MLLQRAGIAEGQVGLFTEEITFQRGKRDLYDAPLLMGNDGRHYLLAPLLASASIWQIVLSQLGSSGVSFETKGSAFEKSVLRLFQSNQVPAKGFKYVHDGQQFECDVAAFWGKHLFVLECKNGPLPTSRPVSS
jgi:hypothetical protein